MEIFGIGTDIIEVERIKLAIKKILHYLGIFEFKRERPPPGKYDCCDEFVDYSRDDYIDCEYVDF